MTDTHLSTDAHRTRLIDAIDELVMAQHLFNAAATLVDHLEPAKEIAAIAATLYTAEHSLAAGLEKLEQLLETSRVRPKVVPDIGHEMRQ